MASKSKAAKSVTVEFDKDKTTKNTVRYQETGDVERPLMLYLDNARVSELGDPDSIEVVVTAS